MNELTSLFLSAFNHIEKHLEEVVNPKKHIPFSRLVDRAASKSNAVKRFAKELMFLGSLRNVLVHDHEHDKEVATPTVGTVMEIETLAKTLTAPPRLLSLVNQSVTRCSSADAIATAARIMYDNCFSQLPVYDNGQFIGMLTGETITRWLSEHLDSEGGTFAGEPVRKVLDRQEKKVKYTFLPQDATVFDALNEFDRFLQSGRVLRAIIITANGQATEPPLGIVTPSDIPRLVRTSNLRPGNPETAIPS